MTRWSRSACSNGLLPAGSDPAGRPEACPPAVRIALDRLATIAPAPSDRAALALATFTRGMGVWGPSGLTGDGYPVEFSFTPQDEAIRYTTEIGPPGVDTARRLVAAIRALEGMGCPGVPDKTLEMLAEAQAGGGLRYGAVVGGRHDAAGDRYKLYIEVSPAMAEGHARIVSALIDSEPPLSGRRTDLRMIGFEPATGRIELYFRALRAEAWEIGVLLGRANLYGRRDELFALMDEVYGHPAGLSLEGSRIGYSFSGVPGRGALAFTLFKHSWSVIASDRGMRTRLLDVGARHGWPLKGYAAVTGPLQTDSGQSGCHGMIAFTLGTGAAPGIGIGLRPPEAPP